MAVSKLPEIELECRNGHPFRTRARGGSTVRCATCGAPKHVPADRPRTQREARDRADRGGRVERDGQADTPAADSELADRWARETPWDGDKIFMRPARPGDDCPECDGPLMWEPGRTVTYCPKCHQAGLPAAVAAHYQRRSQRGAEVATRTGPSAAEVRAARVRLRALAQRMADRVTGWIEIFDPDGLDSNAERLALDYQAELAAYLPEIKNAASETDLAEIMAEINEITGRATSSGALDQIERQREAIERAAELAERQAEWEEQAEREAQEEAERAARRSEIEARTPRKAIAGPAARTTTTRIPDSNGYIGAGVTLIGMIENYRATKERKLSKYGPCGYEHKKPTAPERRYWITTLDWQGNGTGYELPNAPSAVVCKKHFALADQWIEEQAALLRTQRFGQVKAVYTELT